MRLHKQHLEQCSLNYILSPRKATIENIYNKANIRLPPCGQQSSSSGISCPKPDTDTVPWFPLICVRLDGSIGSGNNPTGLRPTSGWHTKDVLPDMKMEPQSGPQGGQAGPPVGLEQAE
mmetsp:Transcript_12897/g.22755  ORF Transcript_12897/g.22755 Transcript_12897/m.22755 type:complete len:119 (+) Transcript_12897:46-402(+)